MHTKKFGTQILNEVLETRREPENPTDKYAASVLQDAQVVGN